MSLAPFAVAELNLVAVVIALAAGAAVFLVAGIVLTAHPELAE